MRAEFHLYNFVRNIERNVTHILSMLRREQFLPFAVGCEPHQLVAFGIFYYNQHWHLINCMWIITVIKHYVYTNNHWESEWCNMGACMVCWMKNQNYAMKELWLTGAESIHITFVRFFFFDNQKFNGAWCRTVFHRQDGSDTRLSHNFSILFWQKCSGRTLITLTDFQCQLSALLIN